MDKIINRYELMSPFQNHNAGYSRWTTASMGSRLFFLKELMNPKYPDEESLQENLRMTRIKECEHFEQEKNNLYSVINEASDGNLVRIIEFFRADSRYYLSSYWIDSIAMDFTEISRLDLKDKLFLCRTAAHSLAALHEKKIVHADIKDTNVLIHRTKEGKLVTKIIDFDSSFFEGAPPENEDDLGGDQVYLSPEACLFFCGKEANLTCKMDIFALGLLFHQYMTGILPYFDTSEYDYAHEAVLDDVILKADSELIPVPVRAIVESMLVKDPEKRISAQEVYFLLTAFYNQTYPVSRPLPDPSPETETSSSLRLNGEKSSGRTTSSRLRMSKDFFRQAEDL